MKKRKKVPEKIAVQILVESGRRCCLCFGLQGDLSEKRGQIAHLDHDSSNNALQNLAYLCLEHHDQYDSRTSQSKGIEIGEVRRYRASLYTRITELQETDQTDRTGEYKVAEVATQPELLSRLKNVSLGRCIATWQAIGLSREEARGFANDPNYGVPEEGFIPTIDRPLIILIGEMGIGKSLILERMLQNAIEEALNNQDAPVPIQLDIEKCCPDFESYVSGVFDEFRLSISHERIVIFFLDDVDSLGPVEAQDLLFDARALVNSLPKTRIVFASRPLDVFEGIEESAKVSPLSSDEAHKLIAKVSRHERIDLWGFPQSVKDVSCYPFFSILIGLHIRGISARSPRSAGELISFLVEQAQGPYHADEISQNQLLQNLAVMCVKRGSNSIPHSELALKGELLSLIESRIVFEDSKEIGFQLPIFKEWFAAQALASEHLRFEDLFPTYSDVDKWQYALQIFVSTFSYDQISKILVFLCERFPAMATRIVAGSVARWGFGQKAPLLSETDFGSRVLESMNVWKGGVGELAWLIAPVNEHGSLKTLGISLHEDSYTVAWYRGTEPLPSVHLLTREDLEGFDFPTIRSGTVWNSAAWPWHHTLEQLKKELSTLLESKAFSAIGPVLSTEDVWQTALSVSGHSSLHAKPIRLSELEQKIGPASTDFVFLPGGTSIGGSSLMRLREAIHDLRARHIEQLHPPWPGPDLIDSKPSWIWDAYSPEQLFLKTKMVYAAAILSYKLIVDRWFSSLANRMWTATMLPACLHGTLSPHKKNQSGSPSLLYYWEPLSQNKESIVDITLGEVFRFDSIESEKILTDQRTQIRKRRPEAADWMSRSISQTGLGEILETNPVAQIVHKWLESDLESIDWV